MDIPVYLFTGFLDAGKTKFISETLADPRFESKDVTLILLCEEGEEEYDLSKKDLNSIEEACMVEIELTIEAKDEEETTTQEVVCVKIDGDWYILQADLF